MGFALLAAVSVPGSPARAYVRYVTSAGAPFAWRQTCVRLTAYPNDLTDLAPAQTMDAAVAAASAWSAGQLSCTFLDIEVTGSSDPAPRAGYDGRGVLVFLKDSWCAPNDPPGQCSYDPAALAITSVFVKQDGTIVDGDIEVNARYFVWNDLVTNPTPGAQDLQNALTHEMGHLIGLNHTCLVPGSAVAGQMPLDNLGNPVPDCTQASPAIMETTMYPSATPGDVSRRTLAADDIQAVCDIYPKAQDPMYCPDADAGAGGADAGATHPADAGADAPADHPPADGGAPRLEQGRGCGCEVGPAGARGVGACLLLALLLARARRRKG